MNQAMMVQTGKTRAAALMLCLFLTQAAAFADQADVAPPGSFIDSSAAQPSSASAPAGSSASELGDPAIAPTANEMQVQPILPGPGSLTDPAGMTMATPVMASPPPSQLPQQAPQQMPQSSWQVQPQMPVQAQPNLYGQYQSSWPQSYQPAPSLPPTQMAQPMQAQAPLPVQPPMQQVWPQQTMQPQAWPQQAMQQAWPQQPAVQPQMAGYQVPAPQQA
ncbi:MAG TPA: hypothetical protein V6C72_17100, partial [Chroococcales cyanobacterium]